MILEYFCGKPEVFNVLYLASSAGLDLVQQVTGKNYFLCFVEKGLLLSGKSFQRLEAQL